jgi:hypothetical protein
VWIESSIPFSRDLTWNGKTAPSSYLHKQLDITRLLNAGSMAHAPRAV